MLYSKNIPIDFQGEKILRLISTDFWEMSLDASVESPQKILLMNQVVDFQLCYLSNIAIVFPVNPVFNIYSDFS